MAAFEKTLQQVIDSQKTKSFIVPVDIILNNGNILLKGFRILEFDDRMGKIKGLTMLEEYSHTREGREPVFCQFSLNDIKDIHESEVVYS
ncbi:MAG TPA: hypothetical protein VK766_09705 [Cytophagaceae bacterium]|jgi:hypothetical protein|nr:hypothetical protein [Cytophagaceae bacterium]